MSEIAILKFDEVVAAGKLISAIKTPSESLNVEASPELLAVSAERVTALALVGI